MTSTKDKIVFFHVGLPKTASTFLQLNVFPKFQGIGFIKKHDFKRKDSLIEHSSHDRILLSIELDLDGKGGKEKVNDVAEKYNNVFPIIVLRKHGSWLSSKYKYYLRKHGYRKFEDFYHPEGENGVLSDQNLQFYPKIEMLSQKFKNRPLVLFQEELKNKPFKIIDLLAEYTGASYSKNDIRIKTVKKAYSAKQLKLVRRFNKFYNFNKSGIKTKTMRFAYKKVSGLFLHTVAYLGALVPERAFKNETLIPKERVKEVNDAFQHDWQKCIDYAAETRKIYLP
jgi:hypothetical protein